MRLTCWGAAGEVTGSMHLLEIGPKRVLLDCGMFQGRREEARKKNETFPLAVGDIDLVVVSHAHIDHTGRLPLLVKLGYTGPIYCASATRDLASVMLPDSGFIQEKDFEFLSRRGGNHLAEPLYTAQDATRVVDHMVSLPYEKPLDIAPGIRLTYFDAGHMLGSASVVLDIDAAGAKRRFVFSGDIGRWGLPIIRDPNPPRGLADVLIVESTYANKVHESVMEAQGMLADYVNKVAARGGKIFIPAFAIERAQELIYELHSLARDNAIPKVPIYVDSPLAVNATDVFRLHPEAFDPSERLVRETDDLFRFPLVKYVRSVEESKALNGIRGPAIIIAASGMAESGRILHHLRNGIGDHRNLVLIVGFQASYTLGARLQAGATEVRIYGEMVPRRCEVATIGGYSGHADRNELRQWVVGLGETPKRAFTVHGETEQLQAMAGLLRDLRVAQVDIPRLGESFEL
ncbi:MAG TPA: MBL fold metallo-hydrolase [Gemmatimonadales bacterium]|nr:MBL fold metallo-hydrolase [Gemmatimonadales bacterium]